MPDFRALLGSLSLTQRGAARLLGRNERNVRRWVEAGPPRDVAMLLRAVVWLASVTGMTPAAIISRLRSDSATSPQPDARTAPRDH